MRYVIEASARVALICVALSWQHAGAASPVWPTKPIRLVVPFSPGGGTDILARSVGQRLSEQFGQQFVVDNRGGAGGTIGTDIAAHAAPDGYTLCLVSASYGANPALYKQSYDAVTGIAPVSLLAVGPLILIANPSVKAGSLKELIALARAKPDSLNYGSTGVGSLAHLVGALFTQMTDTRMVHVPYKGAGPGLADLIAGQIQLGYYTAVAAVPHVKAGRLRALGVTTAKRAEVLPDVPAIGEAVPGYAAEHWYGMWAPRGTPRAIVDRINAAIAKALESPDIRDRILQDGFQPTHSTPEAFAQRIATDSARWKDVVKRGNINLQIAR
jgi:tripartite-type tricarboxylate transporter receptor subunit TctC